MRAAQPVPTIQSSVAKAIPKAAAAKNLALVSQAQPPPGSPLAAVGGSVVVQTADAALLCAHVPGAVVCRPHPETPAHCLLEGLDAGRAAA